MGCASSSHAKDPYEQQSAHGRRDISSHSSGGKDHEARDGERSVRNGKHASERCKRRVSKDSAAQESLTLAMLTASGPGNGAWLGGDMLGSGGSGGVASGPMESMSPAAAAKRRGSSVMNVVSAFEPTAKRLLSSSGASRTFSGRAASVSLSNAGGFGLAKSSRVVPSQEPEGSEQQVRGCLRVHHTGRTHCFHAAGAAGATRQRSFWRVQAPHAVHAC